jgi:hypothetical protein
MRGSDEAHVVLADSSLSMSVEGVVAPDPAIECTRHAFYWCRCEVTRSLPVPVSPSS